MPVSEMMNGAMGPNVLMQLMELLKRKRDPSSPVRPGEMGGAPPMDPRSAVRPGEMAPMPQLARPEASPMLPRPMMPGSQLPDDDENDPASVAMPDELMSLMGRLGLR